MITLNIAICNAIFIDANNDEKRKILSLFYLHSTAIKKRALLKANAFK